MNDYQYTFVQDSREKKNIAHSAAKKVNGSKSKKCTLPGDYLTTAQKKKLSKTLVDVNLREPMTWEQFKACSENIKREYLLFLRDRYHANSSRISADMFGLAPSSLRGYLGKCHPNLLDIFTIKSRANNMSKKEQAVWYAFLGKSVDDEKSNVVVEKSNKFHTYKIEDHKPTLKEAYEGAKTLVKSDSSDYDDPSSKLPPKTIDLDPSSLSMTFDKKCSYEDICEKLRFVLMAQANGRNVTQFEFTVKFE